MVPPRWPDEQGGPVPTYPRPTKAAVKLVEACRWPKGEPWVLEVIRRVLRERTHWATYGRDCPATMN